MTGTPTAAGVHARLDKWLWCARLFKTRSLAAAAVNGGKVHVGGERVKPSSEVRLGDVISLTHGSDPMELTVRGISGKRGKAVDARALYAETAASIATRATRTALRKSRALDNPAPPKRPDKKARRQIIQFVRKGS